MTAIYVQQAAGLLMGNLRRNTCLDPTVGDHIYISRLAACCTLEGSY
jgi:hypothetical protein